MDVLVLLSIFCAYKYWRYHALAISLIENIGNILGNIKKITDTIAGILRY